MTGGPGFLRLSGLIFLTFLVDTRAFDNLVYIRSNVGNLGQLVTSSTLNWLPSSHYDSSKENIVIGGFASHRQAEEGNGVNNQAENAVPNQNAIYVCRVQHNGVQVAGRMIVGQKNCTVTYLGNVHSYERYELLENVDNAARLSWDTWNSSPLAPTGAVSTEPMYVARYTAKDKESVGDTKGLAYTHYIGTFDPATDFGRISYVRGDGKEGTTTSGEILVETEPVSYELKAVKFNNHKRVVLSRVAKTLHQRTVSNTGSNADDFAETLAYTFNYSRYWGQGRAMLKALNTSITSVDGEELGRTRWGMPEESVKSELKDVKIRLEPGTAINVTLLANYTEFEVPYSGDLVSLYKDGERKTRAVNGLCKEITMMDVKLELSPIYYLSNHSLVPTTPPPPSTEPAVETTTSKPTVTTSRNNTRGTSTTTPAIDENLIVPQKNSDSGNMQNGDGGPSPLKNTEKSGSISSSGFKPSLTVIAISAIVFHRIT